jgi:hypothetical protein
MLLSNIFNFAGIHQGSMVFRLSPSGRLALRSLQRRYDDSAILFRLLGNALVSYSIS